MSGIHLVSQDAGRIAVAVSGGAVGSTEAWSIPVSERSKYDKIFDGLQPVQGLLTGEKVKPVLLNSNLPVDILGHVWDLSDIDGDGMLDREEFSVAMHLVYRALEKDPVPAVLPPDIIPPSKRKSFGGVSSVSSLLPPMPSSPGIGTTVIAPSGKWVVNSTDKLKYDEMFRLADTDVDGYVNGQEIKNIFMQSGLPQPVLAHIWNLCDTRCMGKLNSDQFALAMYLVQLKLSGAELPAQLTSDMMTSSMQITTAVDGFIDHNSEGMQEINQLSKEIETIKAEKMKLEQDRSQRDADVRISNGEVSVLQKELDASNMAIQQLETQKAEAQKRLDELDDKRTKTEIEAKDKKEKSTD